MTCVSDRAFARRSTSRARAASSSAAEGVGAGVGDVVGAEVGEATPVDTAPGEPDGFGDAAGLGEPDGLGESDDRPDGDAEGLVAEGVGGGDGGADGVGSSAFADIGNSAIIARASTPPKHTMRSTCKRLPESADTADASPPAGRAHL